MTNNPFTSKTYELTWLKHFTKHEKGIGFNFISGIKFYKHSFLPYYINVGRNFTNGITYNLDITAKDYKNKTLLIYDVPSYYNIEQHNEIYAMDIYSIRQYKGYLAKLNEISSLDEYLSKNLSKKSKNKFKGYLKKIETCFDVDYAIYHEFISKDDYSKTMGEFKYMIVKRFETLKLETDLIEKWSFYTELIYNMILEGHAIITAIRVNNKPVSMSLLFLGNDTLIGAIKVFDTDYYKFNVGHIDICKNIEFSINKGLKYLDFSKGSYEYKERWTNSEYQYNCHIIYDKTSFLCCITASLLARYFWFKQFLRDKNFNFLFVRIKYRLNNWKNQSSNKPTFIIKSIDNLEELNNLRLVSLDEESLIHPFLKRIVFDKLYHNPEPFKKLKIYKSGINKPTYFIVGKTASYSVEII